jgi:CheY-like chemotaxis protein
MKRALVVDDEFAELEVLAMVLEAEGYYVTRAGNGADALVLLEGARFDLVLCDVSMPVLGGLRLLEAVHEAGALQGALFVLMAHRYEHPRDVDVPVLQKPVRLPALRALLATLPDTP